jgi:peptidoglycan hydrolase CwlO-like protein
MRNIKVLACLLAMSVIAVVFFTQVGYSQEAAQTGIPQLERKLDGLEKAVKQLEAKLDKLERKVDARAEIFKKLEAKLDRLGQLEAKLDKVERKLDLIMKKLQVQ